MVQKTGFYYLLNLCVINAYILYKKFGPDGRARKEHSSFRILLVNALLQEAENALKAQALRGRKILGERPSRLQNRHFPNHIPAKEGAKRSRPARDCAACNPKNPKDYQVFENNHPTGALTAKYHYVFRIVFVSIIHKQTIKLFSLPTERMCHQTTIKCNRTKFYC